MKRIKTRTYDIAVDAFLFHFNDVIQEHTHKKHDAAWFGVTKELLFPDPEGYKEFKINDRLVVLYNIASPDSDINHTFNVWYNINENDGLTRIFRCDVPTDIEVQPWSATFMPMDKAVKKEERVKMEQKAKKAMGKDLEGLLDI